MVKKVAAQLGIGISHDRSKIHGGEIDEFKSAISHTKESAGGINPLTYVLDPNAVLRLFRGMSDKVYLSLKSIMHFFYLCLEFFYLVLLQLDDAFLSQNIPLVNRNYLIFKYFSYTDFFF